MTLNEILTTLASAGSTIVCIASAIDSALPPSDNAILKIIKTVVGFIALNFGHSQNIAPSQAVQQSNGVSPK